MKKEVKLNRQDFLRQAVLKTCGMACLSTSVLTAALTSCSSVYYAQAPRIKGWAIQISKKEFDLDPNGKRQRPFMVVEMKNQTHPIYLRRVGGDNFTAVLMQCTHQGNDLNAHDGYLSCPAHGSEYDTDGRVTEGPAEDSLKRYTVTTDEQYIYINIA